MNLFALGFLEEAFNPKIDVSLWRVICCILCVSEEKKRQESDQNSNDQKHMYNNHGKSPAQQGKRRWKKPISCITTRKFPSCKPSWFKTVLSASFFLPSTETSKLGCFLFLFFLNLRLPCFYFMINFDDFASLLSVLNIKRSSVLSSRISN